MSQQIADDLQADGMPESPRQKDQFGVGVGPLQWSQVG